MNGLSVALLLVGVLLVVGGIAAWSVPAAAVLSGCVCVAVGVANVDVEGRK